MSYNLSITVKDGKPEITAHSGQLPAFLTINGHYGAHDGVSVSVSTHHAAHQTEQPTEHKH